MIKGLNIVLFFTCVIALVGVYGLKFQTENIASEKVSLLRAMEQQNANLSVLRADWAYLTQPSHVAPIVERHAEVLGLEIVSAEQFGRIEDLPMRPDQVNNAALTALLTALEAGIDPIGDQLAELLVQ